MFFGGAVPSKLGVEPSGVAAIRGRCRCGHWACFHRSERFVDIDPCRLCLCGYFEDGLEVPPPPVAQMVTVSRFRFMDTATA